MHLTERTVEQDQGRGGEGGLLLIDVQKKRRWGEQRNRRATGASNLKTRVWVSEVRSYHAQIPVVGAH